MVVVRKVDSLKQDVLTIAELDDRRAAFVRHYSESGGRPGSAADAAVAAGFAQPGPAGRAAARVRASQLLRDPKVLEVLRDELTRKLNAGATLGVFTLIDLCQNAKSERVRLSAAESLVDRGFGPVMSRTANLNVGMTIEDYIDRLSKLSDQEKTDAIAGDSSGPQTIDHDPSNGESK
jgi:phage terminase small subunit